MRQLVTSALASEPAPEFVEKVPGANKVVIACVSGLGMAKAEVSMAAGVRHNGGGGMAWRGVRYRGCRVGAGVGAGRGRKVAAGKGKHAEESEWRGLSLADSWCSSWTTRRVLFPTAFFSMPQCTEILQFRCSSAGLDQYSYQYTHSMPATEAVF